MVLIKLQPPEVSGGWLEQRHHGIVTAEKRAAALDFVTEKETQLSGKFIGSLVSQNLFVNCRFKVETLYAESISEHTQVHTDACLLISEEEDFSGSGESSEKVGIGMRHAQRESSFWSRD